MRVNSREVVPKCTFFTLRSSSRIPMASTYLLYTEEIKIKKSVTDSASFETGIKIGLRPFSGTKSDVHDGISSSFDYYRSFKGQP